MNDDIVVLFQVVPTLLHKAAYVTGAYQVWDHGAAALGSSPSIWDAGCEGFPCP